MEMPCFKNIFKYLKTPIQLVTLRLHVSNFLKLVTHATSTPAMKPCKVVIVDKRLCRNEKSYLVRFLKN